MNSVVTNRNHVFFRSCAGGDFESVGAFRLLRHLPNISHLAQKEAVDGGRVVTAKGSPHHLEFVSQLPLPFVCTLNVLPAETMHRFPLLVSV